MNSAALLLGFDNLDNATSYASSGLSRDGLLINPALIQTEIETGDGLGSGWNDAPNLSDGNLWSSWSPQYQSRHRVRLSWGESVPLTTLSVLVRPGNGFGGELEVAIADQTYQIALDRPGWITLALPTPVTASQVLLTRDAAQENIAEIVFGAAPAAAPPTPPPPPTQESPRRSVEQRIGTNWFIGNPIPRAFAGILRDLRPGESLIDEVTGSFSPSKAAGLAYGYGELNDPSNPLPFFSTIGGGLPDRTGRTENRMSDFDIPDHFAFAEPGDSPQPQSAYETASAYTYHAKLMADIVAFYREPVAIGGSPNARFSHIEHWNEPNRLFEAGSKNTDLGWLTPGEYAAMASADYDAIKAVDPEVEMVMGGLVFEWKTPDNWDSPLHRWRSQPGETLPSWQDRPEAYDPLAWLEGVQSWSEANRGAGNLPFDVLNLHLYAVDESQGSIRPGISPEDYGAELAFDRYDSWRDAYNAEHGSDLELWLTEFGYSVRQPEPGSGFWQTHVADETVQGKWTIRTLLAGLAQDIDVMTQYTMEDIAQAPQWDQFMGLMDSDGNPRQGGFAVERFRSELAGMQFAGKVQYSGRTGANVYAFEDAATGAGTYVVWSGDEQMREVAIALPNTVQVSRRVELEDINGANVNAPGSISNSVGLSQTADQLLLSNVNGYPVILQLAELPGATYIDPQVQGPVFQTESGGSGNSGSGSGGFGNGGSGSGGSPGGSGAQTYNLTTAQGGWNYAEQGLSDLLQIEGFDPGAGDRLDLPDNVSLQDFNLNEEAFFGGSLNGDGDSSDAVLSVWNSGIGGFDAIAVFNGWRAWTPPNSLGAGILGFSV